MSNINDIMAKLSREGACSDAIEWLSEQESVKQAWRDCPRADWMLWALAINCEAGSDRHRKIVSCLCRIARTALSSTEDERPRMAIEAAERWTKGGETTACVRAAAAAAADASYAYAACAAAAAADASYAYAACAAAADAAAVAAAAAADASYAYAACAAAADAAAVAADDAAKAAAARAGGVFDENKKRRLREFADMVREEFPEPPTIKGVS